MDAEPGGHGQREIQSQDENLALGIQSQEHRSPRDRLRHQTSERARVAEKYLLKGLVRLQWLSQSPRRGGLEHVPWFDRL